MVGGGREQWLKGLRGQMPSSVKVLFTVLQLLNLTTSQRKYSATSLSSELSDILVVHQPDLQNHVHDIYLKPKSSLPENFNCVSIEMASSYIKVQISTYKKKKTTVPSLIFLSPVMLYSKELRKKGEKKLALLVHDITLQLLKLKVGS